VEFQLKNGDCSFSFNDGCVQRIQVDFRLGLLLSDGAKDGSDSMDLHIEQSCRLKISGTDHLLDPKDKPTLAPILSYFNAKVINVAAKETGQLTLHFGNGDVLIVEPVEQYTAWEMECSINGTGTSLLCMPGGGVGSFASAK
jgi:hypothetical protein